MSDTCMCCGEELLPTGKCADCDYCDLCHSPTQNPGDEYCQGCIAGYGVHGDDDWDDYDPNICPDCGGDIDAEGYCSMLECGYCIHDDDEAAADAERAANEGGYEE